MAQSEFVRDAMKAGFTQEQAKFLEENVSGHSHDVDDIEGLEELLEENESPPTPCYFPFQVLSVLRCRLHLFFLSVLCGLVRFLAGFTQEQAKFLEENVPGHSHDVDDIEGLEELLEGLEELLEENEEEE
jgi:hypothetical protein